MAFDEDADTLSAIRDGEMYGTVVQNPYEYGRMSVEVLYKLASGNTGDLPEDPVVYIPARQIRSENGWSSGQTESETREEPPQ